MKKALLLIVLSCLFCCCKTTRYNVRETTKTNVEVQTNIREEIKIIEETKAVDNVAQQTDEVTIVVERITAVKLSVPDSLGNQYPVEETTTEREVIKGKAVKYDAIKHTEQRTESNAQKTDNSTESIKEETEKIDKTVTKKTTPIWVVIPIVAVFFFVYLILKKYRIT